MFYSSDRLAMWLLRRNMTGAPRWDQEEGPEQVLRRRGAAPRCRGLPG